MSTIVLREPTLWRHPNAVPFFKKVVVDRAPHPTNRRPTPLRTAEDGKPVFPRLDYTKDGIFLGTPNGFYLVNCSLPPIEYRFYLTYFDQLDIPFLPYRDFWFPDPECDYLEGIDFLKHTIIKTMSAFYLPTIDEMTLDFFDVPLLAYEQHNNSQPGIWSFAPRYRNRLQDREFIENGALEITLINSLPIPSPNNSFEEIVEYKRRYSDELVRLRTSLHNVYQCVLSDPDIERSIINVKTEIQQAVTDVTKSMKGHRILPLHISMKTELDFRTALTGATAFAGMAAYGLPLAASVPLAGAAAMLSVAYRRSPRDLSVKGRPVDFSYIVNMSRALRR